MKLICDEFFDERIFYESISDLDMDTYVTNNFNANILRNNNFKLRDKDLEVWPYIPIVFGVCFADEFWLNNRVYYSSKFGGLSNNGFCLANAISAVITIYTERSNHRENKLSFLSVATKSLSHLKKSDPNNLSIKALFLFLDYFVEINKDLTTTDLNSLDVADDVILSRIQFAKTFGDGFETLFVDNEDMSIDKNVHASCGEVCFSGIKYCCVLLFILG
eukprot:451625_1